MKRRAFFRGMFGAAAAPLAIKAAEAMESLPVLPEPQPAPAPQPLPALRLAHEDCTGVSYTAADLQGSSCSAYCGTEDIDELLRSKKDLKDYVISIFPHDVYLPKP